MASPFPGMDPYLEDPGLWEDYTHALVEVMREHLLAQVRPKYWVGIEKRMYIDAEDGEHVRAARPDLAVSRQEGRFDPVRPGPTGTAVAPISIPVPLTFSVRESYLKIIRRPGRKVVTVIEILSLANKRRGSHGRSEYLAKREDVLAGDAHLVEIDLLRDGARAPFASPLPPADYCAAVHRRPLRPQADFYAIGLRSPLPPVPVPLEQGDPDAWLDLKKAIDTAYDRGAFADDIDYGGEPDPPLTEADRPWAQDLLRQAGLR